MSLAGLGQVLEFMYTAKLSLSAENVDDVLAVASFLQIQDIIAACHALKSLAEPDASPGESAAASATEGRRIGRLFLSRRLWGGVWPLILCFLSLGFSFLTWPCLPRGVLLRVSGRPLEGPVCLSLPHLLPACLLCALLPRRAGGRAWPRSLHTGVTPLAAPPLSCPS